MHRRDFLRSGTAVTIAAGSGLTLTLRRATAAEHGAIVAAAQRVPVGEMTVTALSDGYIPLDSSVLIGIDEEGFAEAAQAAFLDPERAVRGAVNAYAVQVGEETVLIDTGAGALFGPTLGDLPANLAAAGIDPGSVGSIVITHLHGDHFGGAAVDGAKAFPNARMILTETEHGFWTSEDIKASAPEEVRPFFDTAAAAVSTYEDALELLPDGAEIAPGLVYEHLPGHTPGHNGVMLSSGDASLFVWADTIHVPHVQFAMPEVGIAFDVDRDLARETRARVLDRVVADRQAIAGMHLPFPGIGHVETATEGYRFVPTGWHYL
jgi:glyoxylase-like metal-dependent hydrolase (beta-lactamase superfamily II)